MPEPVSFVYVKDETINALFSQASSTRTSCDRKALKLAGGSVEVVEIQGNCSYIVYAGPELQHVVQFRLDALELQSWVATLANTIHGALTPSFTFHGALDENNEGISYLDYILAYGHPEDAPTDPAARKTLMADLARFMAQSWNNPRNVSPEHRNDLRERYTTELQSLLSSLFHDPFHTDIQRCLDQMDAIFSFPMVLSHQDFGWNNIIVSPKTCNLTGVIDWAETTIYPFGLNLNSLERFTGAYHLKNG